MGWQTATDITTSLTAIVTIIIAIVTIIIALYSYRQNRRWKYYLYLANQYYEIFKIELEHPEFTDPEKTNKYKEVWPPGSINYFKYDVYAGMYWAYALDIYDISKYYYSTILRFETYFTNLYTPTFERIIKLHIAWWEDKDSTPGTPKFREFIKKRKFRKRKLIMSNK
jgi:hypothetical protein